MSNSSSLDPKITELLHRHYNEPEIDDDRMVRMRQVVLESLPQPGNNVIQLSEVRGRSRIWDVLTAGAAAAVLAGGVWVAQAGNSDAPYDPSSAMVTETSVSRAMSPVEGVVTVGTHQRTYMAPSPESRGLAVMRPAPDPACTTQKRP